MSYDLPEINIYVRRIDNGFVLSIRDWRSADTKETEMFFSVLEDVLNNIPKYVKEKFESAEDKKQV